MSTAGRWRPGDEILLRYGRNGRIFGARPLRVVEERNGYLAAWLAPGTEIVEPVLEDGRPIRSAPLDERFRVGRSAVRRAWRGRGILKLIPRAGAHSVWVFWGETGRFRGWYVNLERRHRVWERGLDTSDHTLDVWVEPTRRWRWKDEDELEGAVAAGRYTAVEAGEIRAEGRRVVRLAERRRPPFSDGWERWQPDPDWPVPALPEDWDVV